MSILKKVLVGVATLLVLMASCTPLVENDVQPLKKETTEIACSPCPPPPPDCDNNPSNPRCQ